MTTFAELAGEAYGWFVRKAREDGDSFYSLRSDCPEWVHDLVYEAHGDLMPDDWRYDAIHSILGAIHDSNATDADDVNEQDFEICDGIVDMYNGARATWLSSNSHRGCYVDEAVEELGHSDQGVYGDIGMGQFMEAREILTAITEALTAEIESRDESDED